MRQRRKSELGMFLTAKFPTCIQKVDYAKSPKNGFYFLVGHIPGECVEEGRSKLWPTLEEAEAAVMAAGVTEWQKPDCSWGYAPGFQK